MDLVGEVKSLDVVDNQLKELVIDGLAGLLGPDSFLAEVLDPEKDSVVETLNGGLTAVKD